MIDESEAYLSLYCEAELSPTAVCNESTMVSSIQDFLCRLRLVLSPW
eukprot:COSAG03_NODE_1120_length_4775_cov_5.192044_2_plen_47_part_00